MSKTVLTIDDSKMLRLIVAKHMAPFGVKTLEAENGEQGVNQARESAPDLILLDYNMPVMDGYHTLVELKTDPALKPIPVVMLTTETVKETVIRLMKLGLRDYIAKPFTREVLLQKVNPILGLFDGYEVPPETGTVTPAPAVNPAPFLRKPTILVIDDRQNIVMMLKEYIGDEFQVRTADCGKAALAAIASGGFDFLFLDLSLPDISAFSLYESYVKSGKTGASPNSVVAMPLRTAQTDIDRARAQGIKLFLYKPFNREDVAEVLNYLGHEQNRKSNGNSFLTSSGDVRILSCPAEKNARFRVVAGALAHDIANEIDGMAEEGLTKLIIEIGEGFLSDMNVTRKFIDLMDHACQLSISIRLVAESQQTRERLKEFAETASLPTELTVKCALSSMS